MKKICALLAVSLLGLSACVSQPVEDSKAQQQQKAKRLTIVSSGKPSDVLPAFTTYTWSEKHNRVLSSLPEQNRKEIKATIRKELQAALSAKGYQFRDNPKQADVKIGFLFALEDAIADKDIQDKFGLLPGVASDGVDSARYEKGSLLLAVFDNEEKSTYWRTAVQGFVDLQKEENQENNLGKLLARMIEGFPGAGK